MDRNQLVADLTSRLKRLERDGDLDAVLGDDALMAVYRLLPLATRPAANGALRVSDPGAVIEIGFLHWYRYLVSPEPDGVADFQNAVELFSSFYLVTPDVLPRPLRAYLDAVGGLNGVRAKGPNWPGPASALVQWLTLENDPASYRGAFEAAELLQCRLVPGVERLPDYPLRLAQMGKAYMTAFARGNPQCLEAATRHLRQAAERMDASQPGWATAHGDAGTALLAHYDRTRDRADLEAAIAHLTEAVEGASRDPAASLTSWLTNLGLAERKLYELSEDRALLDRAIDHLTRSVDRLSKEAQANPSYQEQLFSARLNLGGVLVRRCQQLGDAEALDSAIGHLRLVVEQTPREHPQFSTALAGLADALQTRFQRKRNRADVDEVIGRLGDMDFEKPSSFSMLSFTFLARYQEFGQKADLEMSIAHGKAALHLSNVDDPGHLGYSINLAKALQARHQLGKEIDDLDLAISRLRGALSQARPNDPDVGLAQLNLGHLLNERAGLPAGESHRSAAQEAFTKAAATPGLGTAFRLNAQFSLARSLDGQGRHREACDAYEAAIDEVPHLLPRDLDRVDAEQQLEHLQFLSVDAAACALKTEDPVRALRFLEQGRSIFLSQLLELRPDLQELRLRAPELADRFDAARQRLGTARPTAEGPQNWEHRRAAARDLDALLMQIRALPGFTDFLAAPTLPDLLKAAADGPVVVVNVGEHRADALLIRTDGIHCVPLPGLSRETLHPLAIEFLRALMNVANPSLSSDQRLALQDNLTDVLEWLWDVVCHPVLTALGITGRPAPGMPPPRVWWVPTGLLTLLPLHAAGHHHTRTTDTPDTVLDRVTSSYATTVRALAHARSMPDTPASGAASDTTLAVAMTDTPGLSPLPGADAEVESIRRLLPGTRILADSRVTRDSVLSALALHRRVHFACHAGGDLSAPSDAHLRLYDGPLSVGDLMGVDTRGGELAFLSGCETARGGARLADEVIHIGSAFQLAGFRHVVATLWPSHDRIGPELVEAFYGALATAEKLTGPTVSMALHRATVQLRDQLPNLPSLWAPFIHLGP